VAVADLDEAQVGAKVFGPKADEPAKAVALEDPAFHQPHCPSAGPRHALQESAAVYSIIVVIVKDGVVMLVSHCDLLEATAPMEQSRRL